MSLAFVVARLLMFVVVTLIVKRVTGSAVPTYDRAVWRELQAAALPLGFFLITLTLYTYIDTVILGIMRTDAETGWYAASYRVYEGLMYAPSALATVLTPRFSQLFVDDPKRLRALFQRSLLGSAAMAVVVGGAAVWLARPMMLLFYGPAYEAGGAAAAGARRRLDLRLLHVDPALGRDRDQSRSAPGGAPPRSASSPTSRSTSRSSRAGASPARRGRPSSPKR